MNNVVLKKIDNYISISMILYSLFIILNHFNLFLKYGAVINLLILTLPYLYIVINIKPVIKKKNLAIFFLLIVAKIMSIITNYTILNFSILINELYYFISFFIMFFSIFFCIISNFEKYKNEICFKRTCKFFLVIAIIFCLYNLFINFDLIGNFAFSNETYDFNFSSFFNNRNNFGKLLFASNIMLVYGKEKKIISNFNFWIMLFLFSLNLIICLSRAAILCTLIFYCIYLLKNKKNIVYIIAIVVAVIAIVSFNQNIRHIFLDLLLRKENGLTGRAEIWRYAFQIIMIKPLFGHTILNSSNLIYEHAGNYYYHNSFLKLFASNGFIYSFLIIFLIFKSFKYISVDKKSYFKKSVVISLLVYSFAEEFIFFGTGFIDFWYSFMLFFFIPVTSVRQVGESK